MYDKWSLSFQFYRVWGVFWKMISKPELFVSDFIGNMQPHKWPVPYLLSLHTDVYLWHLSQYGTSRGYVRPREACLGSWRGRRTTFFALLFLFLAGSRNLFFLSFWTLWSGGNWVPRRRCLNRLTHLPSSRRKVGFATFVTFTYLFFCAPFWSKFKLLKHLWKIGECFRIL